MIKDRIYTILIRAPGHIYFPVQILAYDYADAQEEAKKKFGEDIEFSPINPIDYKPVEL